MKSFFRIFCILTVFALFSSVQGGEPQTIKLEDYPEQNPFVDTLRFEYFKVDNSSGFWVDMSLWSSDFYGKGSEYSVQILDEKTHPALDYKVWIRKEKESPLVIILPGMGGYFTGNSVTAMAELLYKNGYSVLAMNSAMNWQFMESAGSYMVPGFTPKDASDIHVAIQKVLEDIHVHYDDRTFTRKVLLGFSLGAMHTLFIADIEAKNKVLGIDRYMAVNPPVDMLYGLAQLEGLYDVWRCWNNSELNQRIDDMTGVYLGMMKGKIKSSDYIPISADDAKFLIGESYHLVLRDIIYSIYRRQDFGFIQTKYSWFHRSALYKEIDSFGYLKYRDTFVKKYYSDIMGAKFSFEELNAESSLPAIEATLKANKDIRIFHNENDFLLRPSDLEWLKNVMGDRITLFNYGGHLGNFHTKEFQQTLIEKLK